MNRMKLAVSSVVEGRQLIRDRMEEVDESSHPGMLTVLKLVPAKKIFGLEDPSVWVDKMLTLSATAPEAEMPGIAEALGCLLSLDEWPAADLIQMRRRGA